MSRALKKPTVTLLGATCAPALVVFGGCRAVSVEPTAAEIDALAEVLPCAGSMYGEDWFGTVTFLGPGRAVTAAHVLGDIREGDEVTFGDPNGASFQMRVALRADGAEAHLEAPWDDWAVLLGDNGGALGTPVEACDFPASQVRPAVGRRVFVIGKRERAKENGRRVLTTRVRAVEVVKPPSGWEDERLIWMRWATSEDARGMSGGPVVAVDADGAVTIVGISVMGHWRTGGLFGNRWLAARVITPEIVGRSSTDEGG